MADPTAIVSGFSDHQQDVNRRIDLIKTDEALVKWALSAVDYSTGLVEFGDDADNLVPIGYISGPSDGNNDNLTGNGTNKAVSRGGVILKSVTVTGASAITDKLKPVFCTDGQTLTLTETNPGLPVGFVVDWISSTTCDVYLFSAVDQMIMFNSKPKKEEVTIGYVGTNALQGTTAGDLIKWTAYDHYTIDSLHAACVDFDNAALAGDVDLNLEIGTTNLTGGVLTLGFADCDAADNQAVQIDATAITAANEVHEGDVITLERNAGTGFTADVTAGFRVWMVITRLPGA